MNGITKGAMGMRCNLLYNLYRNGIEELYSFGITSVIGILPGVVTIEEALKSGGTNMERAVENIVRIL